MLPAAKCCTTSKRGRMRENLTALIKLLGLSLLLCGREMGDKTYIIYTDKHEKHWLLWFVTDKGQKRKEVFLNCGWYKHTDLISLNLNDLVLTSANFLGVTRLVVPGFVTLSLSLVLFEFCMFKHQMPRYGLAVIHLKSRSAMQGCISQSPLLSALTLAQRLCAARGCDYTFQFGVLHQKHQNLKSPTVGAQRGRYCRCNTRTLSDLLIEA